MKFCAFLGEGEGRPSLNRLFLLIYIYIFQTRFWGKRRGKLCFCGCFLVLFLVLIGGFRFFQLIVFL